VWGAGSLVEEELKQTLRVKLSDLFRATLSHESGNEGYIGIARDCSRYHVVAPVDRQIARGLKFYAQPDDGTPFGGYKDWLYFCCPTYSGDPSDGRADHHAHLAAARENAWFLQKWGAAKGIEVSLVDDLA
jgi:hypothetical protein